MAAITAGTGGTISAATAEGAAFQLFQWWQMQESNDSINPLNQEYFTGSKNTDTGNQFFEGKWKLQFGISNTGQMTALSIYQNLAFAAGTGGTISATTAEEYTLELLLWIINKQKDGTSNPEKSTYFTATANFNEGIIEGDFKIPYTTTLLANGGVQDIAREFLL